MVLEGPLSKTRPNNHRIGGNKIYDNKKCKLLLVKDDDQ